MLNIESKNWNVNVLLLQFSQVGLVRFVLVYFLINLMWIMSIKALWFFNALIISFWAITISIQWVYINRPSKISLKSNIPAAKKLSKGLTWGRRWVPKDLNITISLNKPKITLNGKINIFRPLPTWLLPVLSTNLSGNKIPIEIIWKHRVSIPGSWVRSK